MKLFGWKETPSYGKMIISRWLEGEKATGVYTQYWPLYIETYANLLYKVGETAEGLKWQELAVTKNSEL